MEIRPLKICIFIHRFDDGGAEKMTIRLVHGLRARGHEVTVLLRQATGPLQGLLSPEIPVLDMGLPERGKLRKNLRTVLFLRRCMTPGRFDVLVAVTAQMSQVAAFSTFLKSSRIPLVSVVHSTLSQEANSFQWLRQRLFPVLNRRYEAVIAVSKAVREDYIGACLADPDQVEVIYNPVIGPELFSQLEAPVLHPWLGEGRGFVTLVQAGRLSAVKNHKLMFRTLKRLRERGDFRLILLGDGELRGELQEEAVRLGLGEQVDFMGYV